MKRKGETLTEFLAAVTVFGLMVSGIFEFIANQTENLADIKNKDEIKYHAQRFEAISRDKIATLPNNWTDTANSVKYTLTDSKKNITVTLLTDDEEERASMTFSLKP